MTYKVLHLHAAELAHVLIIVVRRLVVVRPRRHGRDVVGVREEETEAEESREELSELGGE